MGLHVVDICVLVGYLVVIAGIGFWTARKIKNSEDFFMPRKFGKLMMVFFAFGAGTHSDQAVSVTAKSFTNGLPGIWYQWLYLPITPFYWLIAPVLRRCRAITTGDIFEARFSPSVSVLYAVVGIFNLMVSIGIMLKGSGAVISACTGGAVKADVVIALMTVMFVFYGVAGGLAAAIITDFIQGILTVIFSFLLLPLVMNAVGGLDGIRESIGNPEMLSLLGETDITVFYVAVIAFNALVGIATQPHILGSCAAGRTEFDGQVGFMGGMILKRICTIPWCLTGIAGIIYFAGTDIKPDHVFGAIAGDFLPKVMPGLLGVFIAALLASVMSSCDAFMISCSALFTENIYKRMFATREPKHYVLVGRIAAVGFVVGGVAFAYGFENVVQGLEIFWKIPPLIGIAFWLGLLWRRMTASGAWAGTLAAVGAWWLSSQGFFIRFLENLPVSQIWSLTVTKNGTAAMYLPWQMLFYLAVGAIAGITVSLVSRPVPSAKLDKFYALIRTPVRRGEVVTSPCTLPVDAVVPPRRNLLPSKNIELPVPSLTSVVGFTVGLVSVIALVFSLYLIVGF